MSAETFLDGRVTLHCGDSRDVLRTVPDASIHSVVCDPPYALVSIGKRFGRPGAAPAQHGTDGLYARASAGFMGQGWDTGETAFAVGFWGEVLRVLKPGGHVVAFGGTRSYHRLACAIEDAGFEIRDQLAWCYGSGFPKGLNVVNHMIKLALCQSKDDAPLAVQCSAPIQVVSQEARERIVVALARILPAGDLALIMEIGGAVGLCALMDTWPSAWMDSIGLSMTSSWSGFSDGGCEEVSKCITETTSEQTIDQKTWNWLTGLLISLNTTPCSAILRNGLSWPAIIADLRSSAGATSTLAIPIVTALGSATWNPVVRHRGANIALKPAWEPIVLARKPLAGTVAETVLAHGTGALNIDGCRVEGEPWASSGESVGGASLHAYGDGLNNAGRSGAHGLGRWPANVVHDGSPEVVAAFPHSDGGGDIHRRSSPKTSGILGAFSGNDDRWSGYADTGSAARFFYSAKADADDRLGSKHPTIKPVDLMQWLCRLVCPPGGVILDPFAGTGTTGEAAWREGFCAVLIEREAAYQADIRRRMALCLAGPAERKRESVKMRARDEAPLPLFGSTAAE